MISNIVHVNKVFRMTAPLQNAQLLSYDIDKPDPKNNQY